MDKAGGGPGPGVAVPSALDEAGRLVVLRRRLEDGLTELAPLLEHAQR